MLKNYNKISKYCSIITYTPFLYMNYEPDSKHSLLIVRNRALWVQTKVGFMQVTCGVFIYFAITAITLNLFNV